MSLHTGCSALLLSATILFSTSSAFAQLDSGDVFLSVEKGVMVTGLIDSEKVVTPSVIVFTGMFGDTGFPTFTPNPGFDSFKGTFDSSTSIGFNVLEPLQVFNGRGFEATGGEKLMLSFFTASVVTGDGFVPGFTLAVQPNGAWHRHYNMFLLPGPGQAVGEPGVYLLARELFSTEAAIAPTVPFYLLLGFGTNAEEMSAAKAALEKQLFGPECKEDLNRDGTIDGADFGALLALWNSDGSAGGDFNGDGVVDGADMGLLLGAWGLVGP